MRVASSDWCASRIVVSVTSTCFCASIHCAKPAGPSACSRWRVPSGIGASHVDRRQHRLGQGSAGSVRPATSGLPCTATSARKRSILLARSRRAAKASSSGVFSMKRVVSSFFVVVDEGRVVDQVFQELQVGGHAADAELAQRAVHARDGLGRGRRPGRHLDQQRVVVGRDHRAAIGRAGVEPDAEAGRAAVGGQPAVVGQEAVFRVFGGDAALQRVAVERDLRLLGHAGGQAAVAGVVR